MAQTASSQRGLCGTGEVSNPCAGVASLDRLYDFMDPTAPLTLAAFLLIVLVPTGASATDARQAARDLAADAADANALAKDADDEAGLGENVTQDVPDSSIDLSVDVDRWVLHDILSSGAAQTLPWSERLAPRGVNPGCSWQQPDWPARLQEQRLIARLQGEPEQHHAVDVARLSFDIPLADHPLVDLYIDYFTGRGRIFFEKWLARSGRYAPMMRRILSDRGLPEDLIYLAMVESGFSASAYSSARAAGYWQFIGSTGQLYGLRHDMWVDERRDFVRATEAAASYLSQLHRQMGDWHLAWACYNAGEGRVRRALGRYKTHNFWTLIKNPHSLAKETTHYVPKIIAAAMIAKDAERYGFKNVEWMEPLDFDEINVKDAVDLRRLADRTGVPLLTLRELNPALLHDMTPPGRLSLLRVPAGRGTEIAALVSTLPPAERLTYWQHRVRQGDTLSGIARRYHADMRGIMEMNHLRNAFLRVGQQVMVPVLPLPAYRLAQAGRSRAVPAAGRPPKKIAQRVAGTALRVHGKDRVARHVVTQGDTLWSIARRYGVSVDRIRSTNVVRRATRLAIGEVLEIF